MLLRNNESSISTTVDAGISEVYIKLNERDFKQTYQVVSLPGTYSDNQGPNLPGTAFSLPGTGTKPTRYRTQPTSYSIYEVPVLSLLGS